MQTYFRWIFSGLFALLLLSTLPELADTAKSLYPDIDDYVKGERARWALTLEHWDEQWIEVDVDKNPSLYYPAP